MANESRRLDIAFWLGSGSRYLVQRRIVARVDKLMSLCDALEAGLLRSQADGERLMEAVVGRMLVG